jgi:hypothetical protein
MPGTQEYFGSSAPTLDRRRHPRKITALNYVTLGDSNGGIILNVSEGGLALTAAEVLVVEYLPCVRFQLAMDAKWIETSGLIVWLTGSKKGAGIQFVDLTDEDRNQITQWILMRSSPSGVQDSMGDLRESENQIGTPPSLTSKKLVSESEIVDTTAQRRLEEMFPSENASQPEAERPTEIPVQPYVTQANRSVVPTFPDFGYGTRNDWFDPETTAQTSNLRLVFFAILLTATSFVLGVAVGRGSFDQWIGSLDRLTSDPSQQAPTAAAPSADSLAGPSGPPKTDASEQSADISAQQLPAPASPISHASDGGDAETSATGTPSDAPRVTGGADNKTPLLNQPREQRLVTAPEEGNRPFLLTMPAKAVSASSSIAISYQSLILVPPEPGPGSSHHPERLLVGGLIFHVEPQYPRGQVQTQPEEIVRLRATVGENGQVTDVKLIIGPIPLVPAATNAIREWRYMPTLLNGRPINTEAEIIIMFRTH